MRSLTSKIKYIQSKAFHKVHVRKIMEKGNTKTTKAHINRSMLKNCCSSLCASEVSFEEVKETRKWFHTEGHKAGTEAQKNSLLKEIIDTMERKHGIDGSKEMFRIVGTAVNCTCAFGMKKILGISSKKWNKVKNGDAAENIMEGGFSRRSVISNKEELVYRFLKGWREEFSENLPNQVVFELRSNFTIHEVMRMFETRFTQRSVSISYLCTFWEVEVLFFVALLMFVVSHIVDERKINCDLKIRAYSKFSKCDICFKTKKKKRKFANDLEKGNVCFEILG
jgi:hypothetical protein